MANMGVGGLLLSLWVLSAAMQTSQGASLRLLSVSPNVTAACGQSVALSCAATGASLSVKHLSWLHGKADLCSWNGRNLTTSDPARVQCDHANGSLTVIFRQSGPQKNRLSDEYSCKLRSNQATERRSTWVHQKECTERGPTAANGVPGCTFTRLFSDGEVHWYRNQTRLAEDRVVTRKSVGDDCCVTLDSSLNTVDPSGSYSCSLWDPETGSYTASKRAAVGHQRLVSPTTRSGSRGLRGSIAGVLIVSVLLTSL